MKNYLKLLAFFALAFTINACDDDDPPTPDDPCTLIPEVGPCDAAFVRYYFDQDEESCKEFIWGGCEGVVPFETFTACFEACGGEPQDTTDVPPCLLLPDPGPCEAAIPVYFYDQGTGLCTEFLYGGCEGVVPFETFTACFEACGGNPQDTTDVSPCSLIPEVGPCNAAFVRYYFDHEEQACKGFTWGGCEGVVPFETFTACFEACGGNLPDTLSDCIDLSGIWIEEESDEFIQFAGNNYNITFGDACSFELSINYWTDALNGNPCGSISEPIGIHFISGTATLMGGLIRLTGHYTDENYEEEIPNCLGQITYDRTYLYDDSEEGILLLNPDALVYSQIRLVMQ